MKRTDQITSGLVMRGLVLLFLSACVVLPVSSSPAHAYLDPGTGSMLMQAIIGTVAAGVAMIGGLRHKIVATLYRLKNGKDKEKPEMKEHGGENT